MRLELAERGDSAQEYLSTAEAASVAKVTQGTIRRWVREGRLRAHAAGRELRVRTGELDQLMQRRPVHKRSLSQLIEPEALAIKLFG